MLTAKRLAIISDLHLGRASSRHACAIPVPELLKAIEQLRAGHDRLAVNGDLYDLERGPLPSQRLEHRTVAPPHLSTVSALQGPDIAWTYGNHDRVLMRDGASQHLRYRLPFGVVHVEHGDRFNGFIKRWPPFTSFVTWVSGRVDAVPALRGVYNAMRAAEILLTQGSAQHEDPVVVGARDWLDGDDTVAAMVIGHTHTPLLQRQNNGRWLMNPGGSTDQLHALSIDGVAGTAALLRWTPDGFETFVEVTLATP